MTEMVANRLVGHRFPTFPTTEPMYGARKCASWEWAAVAYCERCDWFRHYSKCTVRRAMAYARRHYYAHHA